MLRASKSIAKKGAAAGLLALSALAISQLASAGPVAPAPPAPSTKRAPLVEAQLIDGAHGARGVFACRGASAGAFLELDPSIVPFGTRPVGPRTAATVARREGLVSCVDEGVRGAVRLHPLLIRAVTPSFVGDAANPHIVLAIDGQALGPKIARDDDVYLLWRGKLAAASSLTDKPCPEARWSDDRVVVCVDPARVRGRGPARVRIQSAGRLEEAAGAPVDLERVGEAHD